MIASKIRSIGLSVCMTTALLTPLTMVAAEEKKSDATTAVIFDGKTLEGWDGDTSVFRVEKESIIGGQLKDKIPHNFFLSSKEEYSDFELTLEFRLIGEGTNAGVQLRSNRIPDHHEMIGYQADLGQNYWGALYDESRRNKILAAPKADEAIEQKGLIALQIHGGPPGEAHYRNIRIRRTGQ
jgi:hypothetical protein